MNLHDLAMRARRRRFDTRWAFDRATGLFLQGDQNVANQAGAAFRSDLNNELQSLVTNSSGTSAPSTTYANQFWADTSNKLLKRRNAANSGWITLCTLDETFTLSRSSDTGALGASDRGKTLVVTGSGYTQSLAAAATLGDGWGMQVRNDSSGVLIFDPNGSETMNGSTTLGVGASQGGWIWCDGSALHAHFTPQAVSDGSAWTPIDSSGGGLSLTVQSAACIAFYFNKLVHAFFSITLPATGDGHNAKIGGLTWASKSTTDPVGGGWVRASGSFTPLFLDVDPNATTFTIRDGTSARTNASLSGAKLEGCAVFPAA